MNSGTAIRHADSMNGLQRFFVDPPRGFGFMPLTPEFFRLMRVAVEEAALGYRLVAVVAGREVERGKLAPDTLRCLKWGAHEVVACDLPDGNWQIVAVWEGHSGGHPAQGCRGLLPAAHARPALRPPQGPFRQHHYRHVHRRAQPHGALRAWPGRTLRMTSEED